jgi:hypothetical protein
MLQCGSNRDNRPLVGAPGILEPHCVTCIAHVFNVMDIAYARYNWLHGLEL